MSFLLFPTIFDPIIQQGMSDAKLAEISRETSTLINHLESALLCVNNIAKEKDDALLLIAQSTELLLSDARRLKNSLNRLKTSKDAVTY